MISSRAIPGALLALCLFGGAPLVAQSPTDLAGSWTLNRQLSQFPKEIGFSTSLLTTAPGERIQTETQEDAQRTRFLADEVRVPPDRLAIMVTPAIVTIAPDPGAARTIQPGRRDESVRIGPVTVVTNASWDEGRLTIVYKAQTGRLLRYIYSVNQKPVQLIVDVEFMEGRGGGDKVRRIYEPTSPGDAAVAPQPAVAAQSSSAIGAPTSAPPTPAAPRGAAAPPGTFPASPAPAPTAIDQRPDAPLKGLTRLGVVVEGLGADAAKCGLRQESLETAVTKRLTDAGFRVVRDSDDETYLYVNINTVTASAALCVSRYDVTLYSHAAAPLAHTASPVLLQVELLHKGGLAGGGPAVHADGLLKNVLEYVDQFSTRIRNANN
jgi:hypothetical protein